MKEIYKLNKSDLFLLFNYYVVKHYNERNLPENIYDKRVYYAIIVLDTLTMNGLSWIDKSNYNKADLIEMANFFSPESGKKLEEMIDNGVDIFINYEEGEGKSYYDLVDEILEKFEDWLIDNINLFDEKALIDIYETKMKNS